MEYSFYCGGSGGLAPKAPYRIFFHCAVHDYSLTRLQKGDADIIGILYMNTCLPELTEMLIGEPVNLFSWFDRSFCVSRTCPPVDLSTCLPGLTGPDVNILHQGIMGNPYLFICQPVYQD